MTVGAWASDQLAAKYRMRSAASFCACAFSSAGSFSNFQLPPPLTVQETWVLTTMTPLPLAAILALSPTPASGSVALGPPVAPRVIREVKGDEVWNSR